jgi:class 3 adenylate cyclase
MSGRQAGWLAWSIVVTSLALVTGGFWLTRSAGVPEPMGRSTVMAISIAATNMLLPLMCAAVGAFIVAHRPQNVVGWLLAALGLWPALTSLASGYAAHAAFAAPGALPGGQWGLWLGTWAVWLEFWLLGLALILFPDGRAWFARGQTALVLLAGLSALQIVAVALQPGPLVNSGPLGLANPAGVEAWRGAISFLLFFPLVFVLLGVGALSVIIGFARAHGAERLRFKWVMSAGALTVSCLFALLVAGPVFGWQHGVASFFGIAAMWSAALIPIAIGMAILRYRLYAIDVWIHRTVLYSLTTAMLGIAFLFLSTLSQRGLEAATGQRTELLSVGIALALAAGFPALRRRTKTVVDQLLPAREAFALLFTDIVGSTERLAERGDARWREDLADYRARVRRELKARGGDEVNTAGDSFFATFHSPRHALACAQAIARTEAALGLATRVGVHWGSCEMRGESPTGLDVHIAARVMAQAGPGQIMISEPLAEQVADAPVPLWDCGMHSLKGVPGEWRLYAVQGHADPVDELDREA